MTTRDNSHALPALPQRPMDSHKGSYGNALLIGGSRGMSGSIALSGMATLRAGAGLVRLAVPEVCLDSVAAFEPSYMTVALAADAEGRISRNAKDKLADLADSATAIACGPGLGRSPALDDLVHGLFTSHSQPMVFDADALNALSDVSETIPRGGGPRILTPHPGEYTRLTGVPVGDRPRQVDSAIELAAELEVIVVLKGSQTLITDGKQSFINPTGNPGMATGGSGDVLTGVITGLLCQGLSPLEAARLAVYVHGLAGDVASEAQGEVSLIATDLIEFLPSAFQSLAEHT